MVRGHGTDSLNVHRHGWDEGGLSDCDNAMLDAKHAREEREHIGALEEVAYDAARYLQQKSMGQCSNELAARLLAILEKDK